MREDQRKKLEEQKYTPIQKTENNCSLAFVKLQFKYCIETLNAFRSPNGFSCMFFLTVQGLFYIIPVHTSVGSFAITGSRAISSVASTKVHLQYCQNSKIIQSIIKQNRTKSSESASGIFNKQYSTWMYLLHWAAVTVTKFTNCKRKTSMLIDNTTFR